MGRLEALGSIPALFASAALMVSCGSSSSTASPSFDGGLDGHSTADAALDAPLSGDGCAAQVQSDPKNCGSCGHDCLGSACNAGMCQPADISVGSEGTEFVSCFTIDQTSIYYSFKTNTGSLQVNKVPIAGGAPVTLAAGESGCPMLVVGSSLYWLASPTTLRTVPIAGGTPTTAVTLTGTDRIQAIPNVGPLRRFTTDGTNIYWVEATTGANPMTEVRAVPLAGGAAKTIGTGTNAGPGSSATALDSQFVYFFDGLDLEKVPVGGGTPELLANGTVGDGPVAVAVDSKWAYLLLARYYLMKVPLSGGVAQSFGSASFGLDMVIDSTSAYYCETRGLSEVALTGGAGSLLFMETNPNPCAVGLAVDSTWVYFASGDAVIHRLAK